MDGFKIGITATAGPCHADRHHAQRAPHAGDTATDGSGPHDNKHAALQRIGVIPSELPSVRSLVIKGADRVLGQLEHEHDRVLGYGLFVHSATVGDDNLTFNQLRKEHFLDSNSTDMYPA